MPNNDNTHHETEGEYCDYITCPYCGYEDKEFADYPSCLDLDGDTTILECDNCGREFEVMLSVWVNYSYMSRITKND